MELPWKIDYDPMLKPNTIIMDAGGTKYMIKSVNIKDGVATVDAVVWLNQPLEHCVWTLSLEPEEKWAFGKIKLGRWE